MISSYIKNLVDTIPNRNNMDIMDIILDGGLFNGSYLAGALLFIREMELRGSIKVRRLSGCSVGSIAAVLYHLDAVKLTEPIYKILLDTFKKTYRVDIFPKMFALMEPLLTDEVIHHMNKRIYITYYNVNTGKRLVKCKYTCKQDVFDTIKRSCFVPFLIDGNIMYQKKYIDGMNPYIFPKKRHNEERKKVTTLYLDLFGYGKLFNMISVRNERTNFHRLLSGALDIHFYYLRGTSTSMCSCVEDWSPVEYLYYVYIRRLVERILYYIVYFIYCLQKYQISDLPITHLYIEFIKRYCL